MKCKVCGKDKPESEFYNTDTTCKEDRKARVRANRASKVEYYREYDKNRFKNDPKVLARHKRYQKTDAGRIANNKAKLKWATSNPIKRGACTMVNNHLKNGRLTKLPCEVCGSDEMVHGHHDDYAYPLNVRWLCATHHQEWHSINGEGLNG